MTTLFGHSIRSELLLLYVAEAIACFVAIYLLMAWPAGEVGSAAAFAAILALCAGLISGASGLYQPEAWSRGKRLLLGTLVAGLLLLLLAWPILRLFGPAYPQRLGGHLVAVLLAFAAVVMTTRLGFAAASQMGLLKRRLVLVPRLTSAPAVGRDMAEGKPGTFEIAQVLRPGKTLTAALEPATLRQRRIWAVVAAEPAELPAGTNERVAAAGVRLFSEAEFREHHLNRVDIEQIPPDWLASTRAIQESRLEALLRRGLDLSLGCALVLVTLPLLLLTALAIKLDSPGPVFYLSLIHI